jgi:hypothetical protein
MTLGELMKRKYHALDIRRIREYESNNGGGMGSKSVIIDGIPPSVCIFCQNFTTSIDFDMDLHLYENHRKRLLEMPIRTADGQLYPYISFESRIEYAIYVGKKVYETEVKTKTETKAEA